MNEDIRTYVVEQFVDLGNEIFWHEKARFYRYRHDTDERLTECCHRVAARDVLKHGGRYRIRVIKEEIVFDSEGAK